MRKLLLLMLALPAPLFSAVFTSNSIGQQIALKDSLEGSGYELAVEDGRSVLYSDGNVVMEREESPDGYSLISDGYEERVTIEDGQRTRCTISENGHETVYTYFYEDERLSSVSVSVDGQLARRIIYLDTASGTPAALAGDVKGYLLPSSYIDSIDGNVIRAEGSSVWTPPVSYVLQEDGSWKEESEIDGRPVTRIYSPEGLLLSTEGNGILEEFRYDDDGSLISSIERRGRESTVTRYADGNISSISYYSGTDLSHVRTYLDSGEIEETRYEDGRPRAIIVFDSDGKRVKEVRNL